MNRRLFCHLLTLAVLPVPLACAADRLIEPDVSNFKPIAEGIGRAKSLVLYEGLPHQMIERETLKQELASKKTIKIGEFPFYEQPLTVAENDVELLRRWVTSATNYWSNIPFAYFGCGGFHPDYCLMWKDGESVYWVSICFGCRQTALVGPKGSLDPMIQQASVETLEGILKKYRGQRPAFQSGEPKPTKPAEP
jgi:hypothetical protein